MGLLISTITTDATAQQLVPPSSAGGEEEAQNRVKERVITQQPVTANSFDPNKAPLVDSGGCCVFCLDVCLDPNCCCCCCCCDADCDGCDCECCGDDCCNECF